MKFYKDKSVAVSLALAVSIAAIMSLVGIVLPVLMKLVMPPDAVFNGWKAGVLLFVALVVCLAVGKFSLKRFCHTP